MGRVSFASKISAMAYFVMNTLTSVANILKNYALMRFGQGIYS